MAKRRPSPREKYRLPLVALCGSVVLAWPVSAGAAANSGSAGSTTSDSVLAEHCHSLLTGRLPNPSGQPIVAVGDFKRAISQKTHQGFANRFGFAIGSCFDGTGEYTATSGTRVFTVVGTKSQKRLYEGLAIWYLKRTGLFSSVSAGKGTW